MYRTKEVELTSTFTFVSFIKNYKEYPTMNVLCIYFYNAICGFRYH